MARGRDTGVSLAFWALGAVAVYVAYKAITAKGQGQGQGQGTPNSPGIYGSPGTQRGGGRGGTFGTQGTPGGAIGTGQSTSGRYPSTLSTAFNNLFQPMDNAP